VSDAAVSQNPTDERGPFGIRYLPEAEDGKSGRPITLDDELSARIAAEVRLGAKPVRAAALCGVSRSTWYRWLEQHADRLQPYARLIGPILLAQEAFEAVQEQKIAGASEWQAAAWILKTRHRREYGDKVEIQRDEREVTQLSREELLAIAYGKTDADQG
jgi:hypothetical protein